MEKFDIYCYGMIVKTVDFMLNSFPSEDEYSEIQQSSEYPGGETGTCANMLSSFGLTVKMDGTHLGKNNCGLIREFFKNKSVDISALKYDPDFKGLEDYVLITGNARTSFGMYGRFFSEAYKSGEYHWNIPCETDIISCSAAALDPCFSKESDLAAEYCVKHNKPYVTIDCGYDSFIHKNSAVTAVSGEYVRSSYPDKKFEEIFPLYKENGGGLTIITNGSKELIYGRKGGETMRFTPFNVKVVSTLGAGDTFKAGCVYALFRRMTDDETVKFASAAAGAAISRYPMQINPPSLKDVEDLLNKVGEGGLK